MYTNTIKISQINLGMTANFNTNHQRKKMKTEVKKATSSSTCLFQPAVSNNIGKYLLFLTQKYFPNNYKYHKVFNKNNVKIIYSSMENIKSIINIHNKEVITEKKYKQ